MYNNMRIEREILCRDTELAMWHTRQRVTIWPRWLWGWKKRWREELKHSVCHPQGNSGCSTQPPRAIVCFALFLRSSPSLRLCQAGVCVKSVCDSQCSVTLIIVSSFMLCLFPKLTQATIELPISLHGQNQGSWGCWAWLRWLLFPDAPTEWHLTWSTVLILSMLQFKLEKHSLLPYSKENL